MKKQILGKLWIVIPLSLLVLLFSLLTGFKSVRAEPNRIESSSLASESVSPIGTVGDGVDVHVPQTHAPIWEREAEHPDQSSVGRNTQRSNASGKWVIDQFGCKGSSPYPPMGGYVRYATPRLDATPHLYIQIRYSKFSSAAVPIKIFLDSETTARVAFTPVNQHSWNTFTTTAWLDLKSIKSGTHFIKFFTGGQQYGVADLDKFVLAH